ncbi:MAG: transcription termination factor NusA [Chitinispirillales bacterium]|nr:transcription termination factor NusA [Chitinispirillales bacterium]
MAKKDKELKQGGELAKFLAELAKDPKAFNQEKGVSLDFVLKLLEESLAAAAQKSLEDKPAVSVKISKTTGAITAYSYLTVVADDGMESPYTQITLSEAKEEYDSNAEIGDEVILEDNLDVSKFGRMAMQHTKQLLSQKIKDHEREKIKSDYSVRVGELVSGDVRHIEKGSVIIDLGKTEALLPRNQQIKGDRYLQGDRIKAVIHEVKESSKGAQVILSRTSPEFLRRLFEVEVPEVFQKIVRIVKIERNPGYRAKVALETSDPRVDPVGACLGMRGGRIQTIVREISNERIDVFVWTDDIVTLSKKALSSAKVSNVYPVGDKKVVMVVPDEELAKAIGKDGSNIKLTSRFLDKEVLIYGEDEFDDFSEEEKAKIFSVKNEEIRKAGVNIFDDKENEINNLHEIGNEQEDEKSLSVQLVESGADLDDFVVKE